MGQLISRFVLVGIIVAVVCAFFIFDLHHYITFENLKTQKEALQQFYAGHALLTISLYAGLYVVMAALSLPGAAIMTMTGGALFGLWIGTAASLLSAAIGATLAFLIARFLLGGYVQTRFADRFEKINAGVRKDGAFYLFTLRLVPVFPFFIINLVMGLTPIRTRTFFLISLLGMLPGSMVYANAGQQLSLLSAPTDIVSPGLILSFMLLGIFPG